LGKERIRIKKKKKGKKKSAQIFHQPPDAAQLSRLDPTLCDVMGGGGGPGRALVDGDEDALGLEPALQVIVLVSFFVLLYCLSCFAFAPVDLRFWFSLLVSVIMDCDILFPPLIPRVKDR
jgi:hypothetical protein